MIRNTCRPHAPLRISCASLWDAYRASSHDRRGMRPQTFTDVPSTRKPLSSELPAPGRSRQPRPNVCEVQKKSPEPSPAVRGTRQEAALSGLVVKTDESRGDAYLVPLSTVLRDRTCEIEVKDGCPLVTKPCVAAYIHGKKMRLRVLQEVGVHSGQAPEKLLERVLAGIRTSPNSPQWFKDAVCPPARAGRILPVTSSPPAPPARW